MKKNRWMIGCFLLLLASSGCVLESEHQSTLDQLKKCTSNLSATESERDKREKDLAARNAALAAELKRLQQELKEVQDSFKGKLNATQSELTALRKQRAAIEERLAEFKALTARFQKMINAGKIKVYIRRGRMIVALPSSVLFRSGKADLSRKGKKALAQVATRLKEFSKRRFLVAGHTDNVPIKGAAFQDNWELSTARALTVTRFLVEHGMSSKNLAASGYGEFDPVRSNKTVKGRRLNRRIELILVPNIAELPELPGS